MSMKSLIILVIALCPTFALGFIQAPPAPYDWQAGAHLIALHIDRIQVDDQGEKNTLQPDLFLSFEASWQLDLIHQGLSWSPLLGVGLPGSGRDENIKRWQYFINLPLRFSWTPKLHTHIGPGLFMTRLSSDGGTAELDNGTSTDSFFLPEESSTTQNLTWSLGGRWKFRPKLSLGLDMIVFNLTESISRTYSASLSMHYSFGEKE